jgi:hypothetical protein
MKPIKYKLDPSQWRWLKWLMSNRKEWLDDHIDGSGGIPHLKLARLEEICYGGEYNSTEREFLNWLRERFILQGGMNEYSRYIRSIAMEI